jgi:CBS domain containing-hemolysin-like protein
MQAVFGTEERRMVREVLTLAERPVTAAMTAREDIVWLDATASQESTLALLRSHAHHEFPVGRGSLDAIVGVVRKEDVLGSVLDGKPVELASLVRHGATLAERSTLLDLVKAFKRDPIELALILGADGKVAGVVTRTDLLEAIAGELPDID